MVIFTVSNIQYLFIDTKHITLIDTCSMGANYGKIVLYYNELFSKCSHRNNWNLEMKTMNDIILYDKNKYMSFVDHCQKQCLSESLRHCYSQ